MNLRRLLIIIGSNPGKKEVEKLLQRSIFKRLTWFESLYFGG